MSRLRIPLTLLLLATPLLATETVEKPKRISGVDWYSTLDGARKAAAPAPKERRKARPILYLRMLGDLAGKT